MMVKKSVPIRYVCADPCSIRFAVGLNPSAMQGEARLRVTRTPTVTLSPIGYRLSAISYRLSLTGPSRTS
jgi:hypothetical protein